MAQKSEVLPFTSCITSRSSKSTKITTQNAFNGRGNSTVLRSATGRLSQHGSKVRGPTLHLPVAKAGGLLAFGPAPLVLALVVVGADALVVHHPLDRRVEVERLRLVLAEYVVDALGPPSLCSVVDLEHRFFPASSWPSRPASASAPRIWSTCRRQPRVREAVQRGCYHPPAWSLMSAKSGRLRERRLAPVASELCSACRAACGMQRCRRRVRVLNQHTVAARTRRS